MDTEDQILKGTKLITKYQKAKIKNLEQRLDSEKHNTKQKFKTKSITKIILKNIYEICFKNRVFFEK